MPSDERIDLLLRIETQDPLQGLLRVAGGPSREFRGWLGLAAAIEELTRPAPGTPTPTASPSED